MQDDGEPGRSVGELDRPYRPTTLPPSRLLIIGCGGSGKSTVARQVAARTGLPLIHLDKHFWSPGWVAPHEAAWTQKVDQLIRGPAWIIDGNYGGTMEKRLAACDAVVFLDYPTLTCLWRVLKRRVNFAGRTRPDMGDGCEERLTWEFLRYILMYRRTRRPKILRLLGEIEQEKRVAILKYPTAVEGFLAGMPDTIG